MFTYLPLKDGDSLKDISNLRPYKCLVLICEKVSDPWQHSVCDWLADTGCLYMMAWGIECSIWDDNVDTANLKQFDFGDIPENKDIMTTWHEEDSLEEVIYFAKHLARHPVVELHHFVILDIGQTGRQDILQQLLDTA